MIREHELLQFIAEKSLLFTIWYMTGRLAGVLLLCACAFLGHNIDTPISSLSNFYGWSLAFFLLVFASMSFALPVLLWWENRDA